MLRSATLFAAAGLALAPTGTAQNVPTNFVIDTIVSSGLNAPMDFSFLADARVLVANRAGPVSIYAGTNAVTIGTIPNVQSGGERGLLSIEPDPDFATNGYIYVYFSSSQTAAMHLERYTCTGDLSNPASTNVTFSAASRRVILNTLPDVAFNHNGGTCRFGPDGMLYLTVGDDANACTAQNQNSKSGCLLRMDVSTLGPGSGTSEPSYNTIDPGNNPNSASANFNQLVVAYGLRNPFRMDIDQMTGNVYIGDVGLSTAEEYSEYIFNPANVTLVNFGWPWREGLSSGPFGCGGSQPGGLTDPIAAVTSGSWNSVMGGPRYRNQGQPFDLGASYEGDCFFSDFYSGELRRIKFNGTSWAPAPPVPGQSGANWGTGFNTATSMRVGPDGGLWFCQNTSQSPTSGGSLERIRSLGPTNSVTAISGGDQIGPAGEPYSQPLIVQVLDTTGQPLPGGTVNFSVTGGHTLSTTNPVIADASGFAQTSVTASAITGGAFTVTGSTPGSQTNAVFPMFSRKMNVTGIVGASTLLVLSVVNQTDAVPAQIPYIVFMSFPGSPTLPSPIGPICTDPTYALTVTLEDGVGSFGGISFSGTGAIGTPSKSWVYQGIPNFLLSGFNMSFQTVGYDPLTGWFRTNCELEQF